MHAFDIGLTIRSSTNLETVLVDQRLRRFTERGRHDDYVCSGATQQADLPRRNLATADDQTGSATDLSEKRQVVQAQLSSMTSRPPI